MHAQVAAASSSRLRCTRSFRGTSIGDPTARADGSPAVFQEYFSSHYSTGILAVAGAHSLLLTSHRLPPAALHTPLASSEGVPWPSSSVVLAWQAGGQLPSHQRVCQDFKNPSNPMFMFQSILGCTADIPSTGLGVAVPGCTRTRDAHQSSCQPAAMPYRSCSLSLC